MRSGTPVPDCVVWLNESKTTKQEPNAQWAHKRMEMVYTAVIKIAVRASSMGQAEDVLSETMRDVTFVAGNDNSSFVDWSYYNGRMTETGIEFDPDFVEDQYTLAADPVLTLYERNEAIRKQAVDYIINTIGLTNHFVFNYATTIYHTHHNVIDYMTVINVAPSGQPAHWHLTIYAGRDGYNWQQLSTDDLIRIATAVYNQFNRPVLPVPKYLILSEGELIQEGDEYYNNYTDEWLLVSDGEPSGEMLGDKPIYPDACIGHEYDADEWKMMRRKNPDYK